MHFWCLWTVKESVFMQGRQMGFVKRATTLAVILFLAAGKSQALNRSEELQGDRVKYYDPSIYRLPGEWIFIQCNSHPELQAQLIFKPNGTNKTHRVYHDKKVLGQRNTNNFNITCLSYKDSGQYTCTINLGIHEKTKHKLIVLREGKAYRKAKIELKPKKAYYDVGSNVNLTCEAEKNTNLYKIIWYKLDSQGRPFEKKSALNGSGILTLTINPLTAQNSGSYKCEISRPEVHYYNSQHVDINIKVKPEIQLEENYEFKKGMIINCSLKNAKEVEPPHVNYTWSSCDNDNCNDEANWRLKRKSYSLKLNSQTRENMKYRCTAKNAAGNDSKVIKIIDQDEPTNGQKRTFIFIAAGIGLLLLVLLLFKSFVLHKRKKLYGGFYLFSEPPTWDYIGKLDISKDIHEQIHKLPFIPEWEFPRDRITFVNELGSGQFGRVWLAEVVGISAFHPRDLLKERESGGRFSFLWRKAGRDSYLRCKDVTNVAIKSIKEHGDAKNLVDLQSELKILIHVGEHENIVNIVGACTKGKSKNLWIIMEYCPNGNLRNFVRSSRRFYDVNEETLIPEPWRTMGPKTLMYFAFQISKGMTFLISRKVIHRDLAARNILLGNQFVAKIGDFGMARDVYKRHKYIKKTSRLVPIKWMAIESVRDSIFTEKSDVWSFGILLWELFTLGGTPYPGVDVNHVYELLLRGERMEAPIHCPHEIYDVMKKCWMENPEDRPNFQNLTETLHEILFSETMSAQGFAEDEQSAGTSTHECI